MEILEILQQIGYKDILDCGQEYRAKPIYRDSDNKTSLCIKKITGSWYDFSVNIGGNFNQLIQLSTKGMSEEEIKKHFGELPFYPIDKYELTHMQKFDKALLSKLKREHTYWINRGISFDVIDQFDGGITFNGRMKGRYVFPIFDDKNNLVGFSGRLLYDSPELSKWKHLGRKTTWIYPLKWNAAILASTKEVILVESIGDMLALWDSDIKNVIVIFGTKISGKIIEFLLKLDISRIILAFNNEPDNNSIGNNSAKDARVKLLKFFDESQVIISLPDKKDFGEMSKEQINLWKTKSQIKSL